MYDVAVDDAPDTAHAVIQDRKGPQQQHRCNKAQSGNQVDHQCYAINRDRSGKRPHKQKQAAEHPPGPGVEPLFQEAINRQQLQTVESGQDEQHQHDHGQGHGEFILKPDQAAAGSKSNKGGGAQNTVG